MKKKYINIIILDIKQLKTEDIQVEVKFIVTGDPDLVRVQATQEALGGITIFSEELVTIKKDKNEYIATLLGLWPSTSYKIIVSPVIIKDGKEIHKYEDDSNVLDDLKYLFFQTELKKTDESTSYTLTAAPSITPLITFPKTISTKSGISFLYRSENKFSKYELLIRIPGNEAYDILPFDASNNNTYTLLGQKLPKLGIDFTMSNSTQSNHYEIQIRGVSPPSPFSTTYSHWSNTLSFKSANALNSLREFFQGKAVSSGIKQFLPDIATISLRRTMWID